MYQYRYMSSRAECRTEEEDVNSVNIYINHSHVQCERPFVVRALYANIH